MHHLAPEVPAARLLTAATRTGALALGFPELGVIEPGASGRLIAIDLPETVADVELYLVEAPQSEQPPFVRMSVQQLKTQLQAQGPKAP